MNQLDNLISEIVSKNIYEPEEYENAIRMALKTKKSHSFKIYKVIVTACASIFLTMGIVFAGYTVYEKIWKEPKEYVTSDDYFNSLPSEEISPEEKKSLIAEDEAKNIALNFLKKLGYENQTINRIELKRNYNQPTNSYYMVKTEFNYEKGLMVLIDSKTGEIEYFNDLDLKYKDLKQDIITEEQAKQIAMDTYKKLGIDDNNYELYSIKEYNYVFENNEKTLWGATFLEKENNVYNKYQNFSVAFIVVDNKILYDTINISTKTEKVNNPIIIQKETAIEIARNKELEFTNTEITDIKAELSIEKMNTLVYALEHELYNTILETEENIRNVWKISIEHKNKKEFNMYSNPNQYMKENLNKEFYIDATTGEIIGGKFTESF